MTKCKGYLISFVALLFLTLSAWVSAEEQTKSTPVVGAYAGVGVSDSSGSGSLMFEYYPLYGKLWYEKIRVHGQLWIDADSPNDRGTSNFAVGAAWCPTFGGKYALFACGGLAYLTDDNTANINQHVQFNGALGLKFKLLTAFWQHYSDVDDGRDEDFIMVGMRF